MTVRCRGGRGACCSCYPTIQTLIPFLLSIRWLGHYIRTAAAPNTSAALLLLLLLLLCLLLLCLQLLPQALACRIRTARLLLLLLPLLLPLQLLWYPHTPCRLIILEQALNPGLEPL